MLKPCKIFQQPSVLTQLHLMTEYTPTPDAYYYNVNRMMRTKGESVETEPPLMIKYLLQ